MIKQRIDKRIENIDKSIEEAEERLEQFNEKILQTEPGNPKLRAEVKIRIEARLEQRRRRMNKGGVERGNKSGIENKTRQAQPSRMGIMEEVPESLDNTGANNTEKALEVEAGIESVSEIRVQENRLKLETNTEIEINRAN